MTHMMRWGLISLLLAVLLHGGGVARSSAGPAENGLGRILGLIYADANFDGLYRPGEALVDGARVELWQNNQKLHEWITDADGVFLFDNLPPGTYTIIETPPPGWLAPNDTFAVTVLADETTRLFIPNYKQAAVLTINHDIGAPGSVFTVRGLHFPANDTGEVRANGHLLGTIPTDAEGAFLFLLTTQGAHTGRYIVTVEVNPIGRVTFSLDHDSPLRPQEDAGPIFQIPPGIALLNSIYLPMGLRQ